ncbi:MAG TPA: bifunctional diaminohydroxyphosphoribosylaminopyrimidine deaminase/5-amino-6-(5-phosphoribosylamino)uracil reductase RibD [Bacteroidales bacterium]|nr:bifunctional diaminohydroxyphosphoribosylaminopyrimidine deaminase/5-amino-6-(5-phosphoribosylamino)uracil reductase RibD [Bacteroidales bacterium]
MKNELTEDLTYMKRALTLAERGAGWVNPNPMVGAVVVKEGRIIGEGYHEFFGGPHAEVNALAGCDEGSAEGATLYITLEPCSHTGKTPPCTDLILRHRIGRVVTAMEDPNPLVAGQGHKRLQEAGIEVVTGILEQQARALNEAFIKFITTGRPWGVLKTAMTLDGKIATVTNASRWITGESSRRIVHRMRGRMNAIMVGINTVLTDDPRLNIRLKGNWKNPLKVIVDTRCRIPLTAAVLTTDPQLTLVATTNLSEPARRKELERLGAQVIVCPEAEGKVDLDYLAGALGQMGIDSLLIEGGSTLAFSALQAGIVDKVVSFVAPRILGGANAPTPVGGPGIETMEKAIELGPMKIKRIGNDLMIEAQLTTH